MPELTLDELKPLLDSTARGRVAVDDELFDRTFTELGCDEPALCRHTSRTVASRYGTRVPVSELGAADTPGELLDIVNSFLVRM